MVFCYIMLHRLRHLFYDTLLTSVTFLVVQWLKKLLAATAGGTGLIPDLGNKILNAA